jgi:hypothetical protein
VPARCLAPALLIHPNPSPNGMSPLYIAASGFTA